MCPETAASHGGQMRSTWEILGIALAVLLAVGGLTFVGFMVFLYIGLSNLANNK